MPRYWDRLSDSCVIINCLKTIHSGNILKWQCFKEPEGCFPVGLVFFLSEIFLVEVKFGFPRIHVWVFDTFLLQDFSQSYRATQESSHHRPEDVNKDKVLEFKKGKFLMFKFIE